MKTSLLVLPALLAAGCFAGPPSNNGDAGLLSFSTGPILAGHARTIAISRAETSSCLLPEHRCGRNVSRPDAIVAARCLDERVCTAEIVGASEVRVRVRAAGTTTLSVTARIHGEEVTDATAIEGVDLSRIEIVCTSDCDPRVEEKRPISTKVGDRLTWQLFLWTRTAEGEVPALVEDGIAIATEGGVRAMVEPDAQLVTVEAMQPGPGRVTLGVHPLALAITLDVRP